jgi:hypothetical protein
MKVLPAILTILLAVLCCFTAANPILAADITLRLVQETADGLDVEITLPDYSLTASQYKNYKKMIIPGCGLTNKPGAPGVLVRGQFIEIPNGRGISVSYRSIEKINLRNVLLAPVPCRTIKQDGSVIEQYRIDEAMYSTDSFYPGVLAAADFTGFLRDKHIANIIVYPIQYNPVSKTLELHNKIQVHVQFTNTEQNDKKTSLKSFQTILQPATASNNCFNSIYSAALLNNKRSQSPGLTCRTLAMPFKNITAQTSATENSSFAVKMVISDEGIYKISYEDLTKLGVDLTAVTNENIKVTNQGKEQPLYRRSTGPFKSGDYMLFYGVPFKSLYTKNNVYWLYQGSTNGKIMEQRPAGALSGYPVQQTFETTYHGEEDLQYWESIPNGAGVDHWFWDSLQPVSETNNAASQFTATLGKVNTSSGNFSMKLNLRGETTLAHHTKVYINGSSVADFTWQGQIEYTHTIQNISPTLFKSGDNTVKIEELLSATVDRIYINWFDISYVSNYAVENDILKFTGAGSGDKSFEINNFSSNTIDVFDISDPLNISILLNPQITQSSDKYTVSFSDMVSGTKTYYATAGQYKKPIDIIIDEPSDLSSPRSDIDYIIITHDLFSGAIQDLADYRELRGLHVEIVNIQDIYDEFSYGIKDAKAIKDFLTSAYNNWNSTDHPIYVLLVGDASIDYRDDTGNFAKGNVDFVPTYLTQTDTLGDTPTDNWFVCVNGTDIIPDMLIGRMCVKTVDDVTNIINKIKTYEEGFAGSWSKKIILAADQGLEFTNVSDTLAKMLPANYSAEKVYLQDYTDVTTATSDLINNINAGSLITNYTGHGSVDNWAGEFLFHTPDDKDQVPRNDVDLLSNGEKLAFVITLNCLNGFFPNFLDKYSLAEELVRAENKGAIACFAPTGLGYTSEHEVLAKNIFENLLIKNENIAGKLVTMSKISAYTETQARDIVETFVLFGDPATELKTTSVSSSIGLLNPGDAAVLHRITRYTFSWNDTNNTDKYKLEFSADPDFPENKIMRAPLIMAQFITASEYTPNFFVWMILNVMSMKNEKLYWRVVSFGAGNEILEYSQIRSFSIKK